MKKILFIFIYIIFNISITFGNTEEYKSSTGELIKVETKILSKEELNKEIKKAHIEQLKDIIKNDLSLGEELIGEFEKSKLNLNSFLNNYYLNKENEEHKNRNISKIDNIENETVIDNNVGQVNKEKEIKNQIFKKYRNYSLQFLKYLSILNFILIIGFFSFYLYNNKKVKNKD